MEKILFIVPPMVISNNSIRRATEPLGVLNVATFLKKNNYEVKILDMACEGYENVCQKDGYTVYGSSKDDLRDVILEFQPNIFAISCVYTFQDDISLETCKQIKDIAKTNAYREGGGGAIVVVGGYAASISPEKYLLSGVVDYVIMGEGEFRLQQLLSNLKTENPPEHNVDGIAYMKNSLLFSIPEKSYIEDLNVLPAPDRNLINMNKYFEIGRPQATFSMGDKVALVQTSKGCPFKCTFCSNISITGNKFRTRSVDNVLSEIDNLVDNFGANEIQFLSENLTADKRYAQELFTRLIPYNIHWCAPSGLYFNSIDEELLELMAKSGAYQITIAIESASERVLKDLMNKKVDLFKVKTLVDKAHSLGICVHGFFVIGMPGETKEEIYKTLNFPFENNIDSVSFNIANALPGSKLYDDCFEKGYLTAAHEFTVNSAATTNIIIPEDSPDFSMDIDELKCLVEQKATEHYVWSKKEFPWIWERKYQTYLSRHPEDEEKAKYWR